MLKKIETKTKTVVLQEVETKTKRNFASFRAPFRKKVGFSLKIIRTIRQAAAFWPSLVALCKDWLIVTLSSSYCRFVVKLLRENSSIKRIVKSWPPGLLDWAFFSLQLQLIFLVLDRAWSDRWMLCEISVIVCNALCPRNKKWMTFFVLSKCKKKLGG